MFGYTGKMLRVDVTARKAEPRKLDERLVQKYLGGIGIEACLLYEETTPGPDPLGPDNVLLASTLPDGM
jgi:aldehyde:ferredoxin oxidoreductase